MKEVDGCNSYRAWGRRGQYIVVTPQLDLVIAVTSNPAQPHPSTAIHYTPLFELVAASVQRKRQPKKPVLAVDVPPDVKAFIDDYNQARYNKNVLKMADLISDRFLHEGVTKQMAVRFLSGSLSYLSEAEILITKFEADKEGAQVNAWFKDTYFESSFMTDSRLIKENGDWKWYGNQFQR